MVLPVWLIVGFALVSITLLFLILGAISGGVASIQASFEREREAGAAAQDLFKEISEQLDRISKQLEDMQRTPAERERREWSRRYDRAKPLDCNRLRSLGAGQHLSLIQQWWIDDGADGFLDYSLLDFRFEYTQANTEEPNTLLVHGYRRDAAASTWEPHTLICDGEETHSLHRDATLRLEGAA